jgi:hypothetical protein
VAAKIGVDVKWTQGKFSALFQWRHDIQACDGVSLCQITLYLLTIKIENASKVCTGAKKCNNVVGGFFGFFCALFGNFVTSQPVVRGAL